MGAVAAGWDVGAWLRAVWESLTSISLVYLVPALALQTVFAAAAWHGILRYAYPENEVRYLSVGGSFERKFGFVGDHPWTVASPPPTARPSSSRQASP